MHQKVRLFIGGQELEFSQEPAILYNYDMDSIQNPTAVKNQYTKTIQVQGTPRNNQIFNDIWDLTRTQPSDAETENYFNPSKRTDFSLYMDGDLYETGYVKLDKVNRTHNAVTYNITLYGGVGDFLYSLTYSDAGEKMKLRDLNYIITGSTTGNPETELDFNITWQSVSDAWNRLSGVTSADTKWDVINFAPCYNGYPEALDADKVLINAAGWSGGTKYISDAGNTNYAQGFPKSFTGESVSLYNGFGFGEMNGKMTEWEIRDLRSYLQRPALRVKKLINACCDTTQNGGYEVELDPEFFNSSNKYYEDAWLTLPMLTDMQYEGEVTQPWSVVVGSTELVGGIHNTIYTLQENSLRSQGATSLEITFRPWMFVKNWDNTTLSTASVLYTSAYVASSPARTDYAGYVYQLVGYDSQGNAVCGSDIYNLTSDVNGDYLNLADVPYTPAWPGVNIQNRLGHYEKVIDGTYRWVKDLTLKMNTNNTKVATVKLYATMVCPPSYQAYMRGKMYSSTAVTADQYTAATKMASWVEPDMTGLVYYSNGTNIYSGAKITKQLLLNLDGTPCDYLLGYLKTFGLYLRKDPLRKKVYIMTRDNFYGSGSIQDWEEKIDHTKVMEITPLTFQNKWYEFRYTQQDKGMFENNYYKKWGNDYGIQKINTGYNFDSQTNDLLKGIAYRNAAEGQEKSPYFYNRYTPSRSLPLPSFAASYNYPPFLMGGGITYTLMVNGDSEETRSRQVLSVTGYQDYNFSVLGEMYDVFPKVEFRDGSNKKLDGSGVFVFFRGFNDMKDATGQYTENHRIRFTLSDDLNEMYKYNDKPCWLWSAVDTNSAGTTICEIRRSIPEFGRNIYTDDGDMKLITETWDFGKVKELYVPNAQYWDGANIYDSRWIKYINDVYDVNTRILTAYVYLPKVQGDVLLRNFYWFNDAIWRINKISDWNVCSDDTTKVEFVKVQNVSNYSKYINPVVPTGDTPTLHVTMSPNPVPASGGVVTFTVNSNQGWRGDGNAYYWLDFSNNYWSGHNNSGLTTFTATAQTDSDVSSDWRRFDITLVADDDSRHTFEFMQLGPNGSVIVAEPSVLRFPASGGTSAVTIYYGGFDSGGSWYVEYPDGQDWTSRSQITPNGDGSYSMTITVDANNTGMERSSWYTIDKNDGVSLIGSVGIHQEA